MAYQIVWTAEAEKDFLSIIKYLKEQQSDYSAEKFATGILNKLDGLAGMPYQPRFTSQPNVQMIQLDKKNVLFFMIENNLLILLSIYPYKKDITKSMYY